MEYKAIISEIDQIVGKYAEVSQGRKPDLLISLCYLSRNFHNEELVKEAKERLKNCDVTERDIEKAVGIIAGADDFRQLVIYGLNYYRESTFSDTSSIEMSKVASELLKFEEGENILDFGCSNGFFIANAAEFCMEHDVNNAEFLGVEVNDYAALTAKMVIECLGINGKVLTGDYLFEELPEFNKGYLFPSLTDRKRASEYRSCLFPEMVLSRASYFWHYVDRMLSSVSEGGRVVAFVNDGALFSKPDDPFRKKLVQSGYVEGLISFPAGILQYSGVKMSAVVFSRNNEFVKCVDASSMTVGNTVRYNNLKLDVDQIVHAYNSDAVETVACEELLKKNSLHVPAILAKEIQIKNSVEFREVANIFPGAQYTIAKFKDHISKKPTGRKIVTSSDINDGIVDWDNLPYIEWNDKFDKYAVEFGDLIITSKSSKVKIAVVDIEPKEKIIVTGGMLIARITGSLDPTFLKIFLESEIGQSELKSIQKGSYITTMNASDLLGIKVPVSDMQFQQQVANKYNGYLSTLYALKEEIKDVENKIKSFYETEVEGQ